MTAIPNGRVHGGNINGHGFDGPPPGALFPPAAAPPVASHIARPRLDPGTDVDVVEAAAAGLLHRLAACLVAGNPAEAQTLLVEALRGAQRSARLECSARRAVTLSPADFAKVADAFFAGYWAVVAGKLPDYGSERWHGGLLTAVTTYELIRSATAAHGRQNPDPTS